MIDNDPTKQFEILDLSCEEAPTSIRQVLMEISSVKQCPMNTCTIRSFLFNALNRGIVKGRRRLSVRDIPKVFVFLHSSVEKATQDQDVKMFCLDLIKLKSNPKFISTPSCEFLNRDKTKKLAVFIEDCICSSLNVNRDWGPTQIGGYIPENFPEER